MSGAHRAEASAPPDGDASATGADTAGGEALAADALAALARCDELAAVSASPGGIERVHLSPEHARADAKAARWMRQAGMTTWQDAAGNRCGRIEGVTPGLPALLIGSHLDTVPDAGRYDGVLGVVLAIAAVARLAPHAHRLPFALEVVAFGDEEGTRFGTALLGSRALAGTWDDALWELRDAAGTSLREAATGFGLDPARIREAARRPEDLVGYLEVHIEQGPRLQDAGRALGVVTSIAGARRFACTVTGEARHAGGTPFERRRDALVGASEAVLAVERIAREAGAIATVGRMEVHPGAVNVVPGAAEFSVDLRAEHDAVRDRTWARMEASFALSCSARGLGFEARQTHGAASTACAPHLQEAVAAGVRATGDEAPASMHSWAGHDGMAVAAVTDVGMLFVRCVDGISHHPDEAVAAGDVAAALDALEATVRHLAGARVP